MNIKINLYRDFTNIIYVNTPMKFDVLGVTYYGNTIEITSNSITIEISTSIPSNTEINNLSYRNRSSNDYDIYDGFIGDVEVGVEPIGIGNL